MGMFILAKTNKKPRATLITHLTQYKLADKPEREQASTFL